MAASTNSSANDPIVGLNVGGTKFFCHRSTLTNAEFSYFAARFDGEIPPGDSSIDENGVQIFFIDRDPKLFRLVLSYLRTPLKLPWELPSFSRDPRLWRGLRDDAEFYGLDDLRLLLHVTYSCRPGVDGRGALHWLGTDRGGSNQYRNPHTIGAVHVGRVENGFRRSYTFFNQSEEKKRNLVAYRPVFDSIGALTKVNSVLECDDSCSRNPVVVELKDITLRLTHYSLRYDACGMNIWNFEGSVDGTNWDVLHESRGDACMEGPSTEAETAMQKAAKQDRDREAPIFTAFLEQFHRNVWAIVPVSPKFYRYFRFIGIGREDWDAVDSVAEDRKNTCMHGVGLELYGDIHET